MEIKLSARDEKILLVLSAALVISVLCAFWFNILGI